MLNELGVGQLSHFLKILYIEQTLSENYVIGVITVLRSFFEYCINLINLMVVAIISPFVNVACIRFSFVCLVHNFIGL
jgi:hypothetical protein